MATCTGGMASLGGRLQGLLEANLSFEFHELFLEAWVWEDDGALSSNKGHGFEHRQVEFLDEVGYHTGRAARHSCKAITNEEIQSTSGQGQCLVA